VFPENSLPAFRHAIALGADAIELDVHQTHDGVIVVQHDPVLLAGDAGAPRRIRDMTYAALRRYSPAPGMTVPSLAEVFAVVPAPTLVYVEVKAPGIEADVLACIAAAGAQDRSAIHSFDHRVAQRIAQLDPVVPGGILVASYLADPAHELRAAAARDYWAERGWIDASLVDAIHGAGGRVIAWTVNDAADAARLTDLGVDAICTDICGDLRTG
jgi:glycerophosphoryl diester phosphodiesterase